MSVEVEVGGLDGLEKVTEKLDGLSTCVLKTFIVIEGEGLYVGASSFDE